jgi:hypothetical protein
MEELVGYRFVVAEYVGLYVGVSEIFCFFGAGSAPVDDPDSGSYVLSTV